MRFLVDAQLPPALAHHLQQYGLQSDHVSDIALLPADDSSIWNYALRNLWVVISKDEDVAIRRMASRSGPAVVWLRVGNCSNRALLRWFMPLFPDIVARLEAGETFIEVI